MSRIRKVDPARPGIRRRRRGGGFAYVHPNGQLVRDLETRRRIDALVIPPAWKDVWICPDPNGHLQAVGTDDAGRRQYRYHDAFTARRAARKWDRVEQFGESLGDLREHVRTALDDNDGGIVDAQDAAAWCVRLLDRSLIRVGGVEYQRRNGTYGLCTLQRRHLSLDGDLVTLRFVGKHGLQHAVTIVDGSLSAALEALVEGRGRTAPLLGWRDGRRWRTLSPAQVNRFIAEHLPGATAKDFRTWHATVLMAAGLVFEERLAPDGERAGLVRPVVEQVASLLGNTPAVTRGSYVHPGVIDRWLDSSDIAPAIKVAERYEDLTRPALRDVAERAVLDLLADRTPRTMREHAHEEIAAAT